MPVGSTDPQQPGQSRASRASYAAPWSARAGSVAGALSTAIAGLWLLDAWPSVYALALVPVAGAAEALIELAWRRGQIDGTS